MGDAALPKEHLLIAFMHDLTPEQLEEIRAKFPELEVSSVTLKRGEDIPSELARKATYIVTFANLPKPEDAENVQFIHFLSAGLNHVIQHPIFRETAIPLTSSSGVHGPPIAEWTVMNWLVHSRRYATMYEKQKKHEWRDSSSGYFQGVYDQVGKRVGILGYGSIGRQIGRVSKALGMTVYAYTASPRPTPSSRHDNGFIVPGTGDKEGTVPVSWHHGTDKASVREFLALGLDHLVISLPLTPQTTHLLGAEEFALLAASQGSKGPKPYLTNISRGKVLDQDALIAALNSGELSGAALDVTDPEPLPAEHPLWDVPNVQISPHVSSLGVEYFSRSLDIAKENVGRIKRGEDLLNAYKRGKGY
ncbi:dehydrogenase [Aspergillus nomiae NRRL 13137]|uniref:Dehydrogenase n=1 Tax=Aspergillus nomiae NRRL (strain ATCC 15546 / NRRL 13137 / CBS 260.88 / M93) TaxID=1509407 RepID=A0A0L1IZI6_ASPN3|nr:dehydrogenase [Aspergillus nomiae NRRL 13137]KNG84917.1 dehydrogenase [Aspergillus nomiae NRRL 13137]